MEGKDNLLFKSDSNSTIKMKKIKSAFTTAIFIFFFLLSGRYISAQDPIRITTPMTPPEWALLERQLIEAESAAIPEFYNHFYDDKGYYLHVARWGALDGTDDVIELSKFWTILHALGGSDQVMDYHKKVLEGAYRQYTAVTTTSTDVAKYGSYYKEFMPQSDFMHQGEGHQGLMFQGLSEPDNFLMRNRYKRFAGFYLNEDPDAINYDPEHKIIRSFWTGSRGPMLREGNAYDWGGDLTTGKFNLMHHSGAKTSMKDYAEEYPGIIAHFYFFPQSTAGDHPLNLAATQLALNAYMLDHEKKYRDWLLEYADSWKARAEANNGNFPSNVGLDGKTGTGVADKWYFDKKSEKSKWYMGTYGWNFSFYHWTSVINHENRILWGIWPGMANAYLVTGDQGYINALRKQIDNIYANKKNIDGVDMIPQNYGIHIERDQPRKFNVFDVRNEKLYIPDGKGVEGWYNWTPDLLPSEMIDLYLWSMDRKDLERIPKTPQTGWISFLEGNNKNYPEESLRKELEFVRNKMEEMRNEPSTPDTRLADWALEFNPATVNELLRLMVGGNLTGRIWSLHTRVRYFDPEKYRAGLPDDVASLVTKMDGGITNVTLVNINQVKSRRVIVQTGAYGEHECLSVKIGDKEFPVNSRHFEVKLDPGAGADLTISVKRYANQPTLSFPW
jgi:hypothetical protein